MSVDPKLARGAIRFALASLICTGLAASLAEARQSHETKHAHGSKAKGKAKASKSAPPLEQGQVPAGEPPPPPYQAQLLRLAEILGALSYLEEICSGQIDALWRAKMQALIDTEAKTTFQKEHLAGTFNRSFRGYQISYHTCTSNAKLAIGRFLMEGTSLAHEIIDRYGAS